MIETLLSSLATPFTAESLFDHLDSIVYFIKCDRGKYQAVNETFVRRCGFASKSEVVGKSPSDLFGVQLGGRFETQDAKILESGSAILSRLELHIYPDRSTGWCLTHKIPLKSKSRRTVGLVGVSQDLRLPSKESETFQQISTAIEHAENNLADRPTVKQLAEITGLSFYQFDRRMKLVFGLNTGQWLMRLRIDRAQHLLTHTDDSIADVAFDVGYADQSAFARQFRRATGLTPKVYRMSNVGIMNE